jgi:hypothetical protein
MGKLVSGHSERSPGWLLQRVEQDRRAGQHGEREEALITALVADPQPPPAKQPGDCPLNPPAVAAKPLRGLHAAPGDAGGDPTASQLRAAAWVVVALVGVDGARPAASPASGHADRRDVVHHGPKHGGVVGVGGGEHHGKGQAASVAGQVQLGPLLAAVDRICAGQRPL